MQRNRGKNTLPELAVRKILHARGFRYRVNARPERDVRRTADLLFTRVKVAVFIDGCYWHGCPDHYTSPATNESFWADKLKINQHRDLETNRLLADRGWKVLRFWEHEPPSDVAKVIEAVVCDRRRHLEP
jgi:DNA mismatch endonuclease (patch repair protein)